MPRLLVIVLLAGLVAGLLVGGFHNLFTVPVIERAMDFEEEQTLAGAGGLAAAKDAEPTLSRGEQRVGMAVGTVFFGLIFGLYFAGGYSLLRRVVPGWQPLALTLTVGALGFWALSLFPFIKYPLNPPGVGEQGNLAVSQVAQAVFLFLLSPAGVLGILLGFQRVNSLRALMRDRIGLYGLVLVAYGAFAAAIFFALPTRSDSAEVPIDLLELFRTLTMVGQFLLWALLGIGVALALMWYQRRAQQDLGSRKIRQGV